MSVAQDGATTLEVDVGPHSPVAAQLDAKADVIRAMHERVLTRRHNSPCFVKGWASARYITCCGCMAVKSWKTEEQPRSSMKSGLRPRSESSQSVRRIARSKHRSAHPSQELVAKRTIDVARAAHLGALVAARPGIQAMINDASTDAQRRPLLDRLEWLIETATTPFKEIMDDSKHAAATRLLREAALVCSRPSVDVQARRSPVQCSRAVGLPALFRWTWTRERETLVANPFVPPALASEVEIQEADYQ